MKVKTISRYDNPYNLIYDYKPGFLNGMTEDAKEELRCACDFESIAYYVVNDSVVLTVDTVTGDVLGEDTLIEFASESVAWACEQNSE